MLALFSVGFDLLIDLFNGIPYYVFFALNSLSYWGKTGWYSGSGYLATFTLDINSTAEMLQNLKLEQWLDNR